MGEIADMMLDGTLCAGCGAFLGEDTGFPCYCVGCAGEMRRTNKVKGTGAGRGYMDLGKRPAPPIAKVRCPVCAKKVKHNGLADHQRDAHGVAK